MDTSTQAELTLFVSKIYLISAVGIESVVALSVISCVSYIGARKGTDGKGDITSRDRGLDYRCSCMMDFKYA